MNTSEGSNIWVPQTLLWVCKWAGGNTDRLDYSLCTTPEYISLLQVLMDSCRH